MQDKVLEVATRIYRKAYTSISGRPDNAWQAKEGHCCVYNQEVNGGCVIGCNLPADYKIDARLGSIEMIMRDWDRFPFRHTFLDALGIPPELYCNDDLVRMLRGLQRAHDLTGTKANCLEEIRRNAIVFGIDLGLGA